ncbi:MAG: response regulator [Bdellovibrionales bacterium]|nr:response regulator [Bdellovibrionales bacterium]
MNLQSYNILVVDDDKSFGESVKQALTRAGFRAYVVNNPADALSYAKLQDVHALVIDCMLPKMNGLELVKKLKESLSGEPPIVLMSGIFKDKQFIKTALTKTNAVEFFTKPFDVAKLVNKLKEGFGDSDEVQQDLNPLMGLYVSRETNTRKVIRTINSCEGLHNFDLPWVFKALAQANATGHLNIACTNGDIAGVGFKDGHIVQVNIKNEASLLGILLVESGYLDRADLNKVLDESNNNKMIGQMLVDDNYVSPHAINIVLKDQLLWRLKRLIADSHMELNFVKSDDVTEIATISWEDFHSFLMEIIDTTIRQDWLKTHYLPLNQNLLISTEGMEKEFSKIKAYPFISRIFPAIESPLKRGSTLEEIVSSHPEHEGVILKVVHYLNIMGLIQFKDVQKSINLSHQTRRLQKLEAELESKNFFERLGVSRTAKETDIKKAYFDLAKVLHPDKLGHGTTAELRELAEKVFEKIQVAYDTLKKQDRKEHYLKELEVGQAEKLLQADQMLDTGRTLLLKGQYSAAKEHLDKAKDLNPDSPEIRMLCVWMEIKRKKQPTESFFKEMERQLNQIPPESRDSATYYHTRGLYCKMTGDIERAKKYFKTALNLDQTFIHSRRELSQIEGAREKTNILQADLKDVVGMLFRKK